MSEAVPRAAEEPRPGDILAVRVFRFDPSCEPEPHYETYEVQYAPAMRVLGALEYINEELGGDVAYRWYCGVRKCGTCAVLVNGQPKLSCWEPAERTMTIEPLPNFPVLRDLVTDRTPYEEILKRLEPWILRAAPYPGFPEPITDLDMADVNELAGCIECLCCQAACPVVAAGDGGFVGPAPLVQLGRFVLDPRDGRQVGSLPVADRRAVYCAACRVCEASCPVGIPIASGAIQKLTAKR